MPAPAPLFRDPIHDGAADPTIIWNRQEGCWWLLYTNRRANVEGQGVAWVHGTDIGVASSASGDDWLYLGTLGGLEFERGRNTFWAPEVLWQDGVYHMFVSYVRGVPISWVGDRAYIFYFTHPEVKGMAAEDFVWHYAARSTALQVGRLELENGQLVCHRDQPFELMLLKEDEGV